MKFPQFGYNLTGVAVPVSTLRSEESCGIGEFLDLVPLGSFCKKTGIDLIQILPINDTGTQISPYSALSAYALHPVYLRLSSLSGSEEFTDEIDGLRDEFEHTERIPFEGVLKKKLDICRKIYESAFENIKRDEELVRWIEHNPWVKVYGVYKTVKSENDEKHWKEWKKMRDPGLQEVEEYWSSHTKEVLFHAWLQLNLEKQLKQAVDTLSSINIALKGDIPILMNEDSADVWMHRKYFRLDYRAGAPPDMYSDTGQNWGFPIYEWETLEQEEFGWWKGRLNQAEKFFHAFRIDHVLGFFRIWAIPAYEETADMGYYIPYDYLTGTELKERGFSKERITWMSRAHIYEPEITDHLQDHANEAIPYFRRIANENLFLFNDDIRGTADIEALPVSSRTKQTMKHWKKNRTLLSVGKNAFFQSWHFHRTRAYHTLSEEEKTALHELIEKKGSLSEKIWEQNGEKLLSVLKDASDMRVCAEDLGVVPDCVPRVLSKLELYSLKIGFWNREYHKPGQPFVRIKNYPRLSVATLSVHDSQVFRQWWDNEADMDTKREFCTALGLEDLCQKRYTPAAAEKILESFFRSSSEMCILQIQDYFALDADLRRDTEQERINVPGTVSELNWTYRIPVPLEELLDRERLCSIIQKLTTKRRFESGSV